MNNNSITFKHQNSTMSHSHQHHHQHHHQQVSPYAIRGLESTINPRNFLTNKQLCRCNLCIRQKIIDQSPTDGNLFEGKSKSSTLWLKKLLDSLTLSGAKTLKLHLPDLLFVEGQSLQTFQTSRKDGRLIKLSGTTPFKSLYPTLIRYCKEYKYTLQLNFNEKMLESIDPQFMHLSYFDKFVPSHFHDGMNNIEVLQQNKKQFRRYILHKNKKYQIQQIEEHKMNHKQPFCIVKYTDGNCQLFNQIQFEVYMLSSPQKLQEEIAFVQSYIKYKLQTQAIYYSEYRLTPESLKEDVDKRAENEVMVLIGGLHKYQQGYMDLDTIQEISHQLMQRDPKEYVTLMTYKIVHYLNMTSRIYIDHMKIKWIMNDLGNIYLQEIMEFQMSEVPRRLIKFRLPPKDQILHSITNTNNFAQIYLQMKKRKYINTVRIKKMIEEQPIEQILQMMEVNEQDKQLDKHKNQDKYERKGKNVQISKQKQEHRYSMNSSKQKQEGNKNAYTSIVIDKNHLNPCSSQRKEKAAARVNRYFTINLSKEQKTSRKGVSSSQTQRFFSYKEGQVSQRTVHKRCGSTVSTFRDIRNINQLSSR